jgi:hypothetical protein
MKLYYFFLKNKIKLTILSSISAVVNLLILLENYEIKFIVIINYFYSLYTFFFFY